MSDDGRGGWVPVGDAGAVTIATRTHVTISPIIIMLDGPRTTLLWRGTDETRSLPDGATDEEINAAARAWEDERASSRGPVSTPPTDPLVAALDAALADMAEAEGPGGTMKEWEACEARVESIRARLSAVLAAARALADGHARGADAGATIRRVIALRDALAAADGGA